MIVLRRGTRAALFVALLAGMLTAGCAIKVTTGAFTQTSRISGDLKRGVSTKMDVQRILGTPKGSGSAVFSFVLDSKSREVWYYEDIEVKDFKRVAEVFQVNVRQQILLVFFEKGVFDGFMWWSNAGEAKEQKEEF